MNIGNGIENLTQIFPSQAPASPSVKAGIADRVPQAPTDKAQFSEAGTQAAHSLSSSEVRLDKVASIQSALQAGTYRVPAADVAQKIIQSLLAEKN